MLAKWIRKQSWVARRAEGSPGSDPAASAPIERTRRRRAGSAARVGAKPSVGRHQLPGQVGVVVNVVLDDRGTAGTPV